MKGHPTLRRLPKRLRRRLVLFRFRSRIWIFRHRLGLAPLCNVLIDRRYGGWSGGSRPSSHAALGANFFGSAHYYELPRIFNAGNDLEITPSDVLVDIGCGKGRVINWWLSRGADNRILGLEIEEDLAHEARERLRRYRNVTILAGNAIENLPAGATIFWLFNPFTVAASGRALMEERRTPPPGCVPRPPRSQQGERLRPTLDLGPPVLGQRLDRGAGQRRFRREEPARRRLVAAAG